MSDPVRRPSIDLVDFLFGHVRADHKAPAPPPQPPPPLGPLAAFVGNWVGNGFNTIFRPNNSATPTPLPHPLPPGDNILELNLTSENLMFSPGLGSVPNRGTTPQGDVFLNGVPYLQTVDDVTTHGEKVGIHVEPGIWIHVPATTVPSIAQATVSRMASIPTERRSTRRVSSHLTTGHRTSPPSISRHFKRQIPRTRSSSPARPPAIPTPREFPRT